MKPRIEEVTREKLELAFRNQPGLPAPLGQRTILANLEKEMLPILRECDLTRGRYSVPLSPNGLAPGRKTAATGRAIA
jgi:hypothetical protein